MSNRNSEFESLPPELQERWRELVKSEALFRTLFQSAPFMINSFDQEGKLLLWNQACTANLGYTREEVEQAENPLSLFYPDPEIAGAVLEFIRHPDGKFREFRVRRKDGTYVFHQWANFTLPDNSVISVGYDTTEAKENQERLRQYSQNLEQKVEERTRLVDKQRADLVAASKFVALGEMAAGVAHEINNPLAIISGNTTQLQEMFRLNQLDLPVAREFLESIQKASQRITRIVSGLRTISRDGSRDPVEVCELNAMVQEALGFCWARFEALGVALKFEAAPGEVRVRCRAVEIQQVILNLLNNAIDAALPLEEKWVKIELSDLGTEVEVTVTDSGKGLSEEVQEKIFQPFFTTKPIGKGTGLGLSISKGIVEAHGGRLVYELREGHTAFTVSLPKR